MYFSTRSALGMNLKIDSNSEINANSALRVGWLNNRARVSSEGDAGDAGGSKVQLLVKSKFTNDNDDDDVPPWPPWAGIISGRATLIASAEADVTPFMPTPTHTHPRGVKFSNSKEATPPRPLSTLPAK